jgi:PBP1b-binding outer membrane lipoprotein LpoB
MNRKIIYLAAILFITLFVVSCKDETPEVQEEEPAQDLQVDRRY